MILETKVDRFVLVESKEARMRRVVLLRQLSKKRLGVQSVGGIALLVKSFLCQKWEEYW